MDLIGMGRNACLAGLVAFGAACASVPRGAVDRLAVPPAGQSTTVVAGCLNPDKAASREAPVFAQAGADVYPLPDGVIVTHHLNHPCCLTAQVSSAIEGNVVTVRERLQGQPCKCECPSTIKTALGLTPGTWEVRLLLQPPTGPERIVQEWDVKVGP